MPFRVMMCSAVLGLDVSDQSEEYHIGNGWDMRLLCLWVEYVVLSGNS